MIYKGSFILQHSTSNKPKHDAVSLTLEREGNSNIGKKETCSLKKWGGRVEERERKQKRQHPGHKQLALRD